MNILFLILYGCAAFINILSIQKDKYIIRFVSKSSLMPILLLFYIVNAKSFSFSLVLALIFSWCGDVLLIKPGKYRFFAGIFGFFSAHIQYIFMIIGLLPEINSGVTVLSCLIMVLILVLIEWFLITRLHIKKNYRLPAFMYGTAVGFLTVFSSRYFMCFKNMAGVCFTAGAVLFFVSDTVLAYYNTVKKMTKNSLTVIMLTYIIAQASLVIGNILHYTISMASP